jgi:hypothetical protein
VLAEAVLLLAFLAGAVFVVAGLWLYSPALALIAAGASLVWAAGSVARDRERERKRREATRPA